MKGTVMKKLFLPKTWVSLLILGFAAALYIMITSSMSPAVAEDISLELTPDSDSYSHGAPILVNLTIMNTSSDTLRTFKVGLPNVSFIVQRLSPTQAEQHGPVGLDISVIIPDDTVVLSPGDLDSSNFDLQEFFGSFFSPGAYEVQATYRNAHTSTNYPIWNGTIESNIVSFSVGGPSVPTGLGINLLVGENELSWNLNPEPDIDHYNVYRHPVPDVFDPNLTYELLASVGPTSYADMALTADTLYRYAVSAVNTTGVESPQSNPITSVASSIAATITIEPERLNPKTRDRWVSCYIELSPTFPVQDIDPTTILLATPSLTTLSPILDPKYDFVNSSGSYIVDQDDDGILERLVKFDRAILMSLLQPGQQTLHVAGALTDGTLFGGTASVYLLSPPNQL